MCSANGMVDLKHVLLTTGDPTETKQVRMNIPYPGYPQDWTVTSTANGLTFNNPEQGNQLHESMTPLPGGTYYLCASCQSNYLLFYLVHKLYDGTENAIDSGTYAMQISCQFGTRSHCNCDYMHQADLLSFASNTCDMSYTANERGKCLPPQCTGTCSGHGTESMVSGSCTCTCDAGYEGDQCENTVPCTTHQDTNACENGGVPSGSVADGTCYCDCDATNYAPPYCKVPKTCTASDITCQNGGAPQGNLVAGCTCDCMGPWTGADCTTKIPCTENDITCQNGGTPAGNLVDGCTCACPAGFLGKLCDTEIAKTSLAQVTSRKSTARAKADKKALRQDLKTIAKDLLAVKLTTEPDLKKAIRETRVVLEKNDFSHNMKKLLVKASVKMAVGPTNDAAEQDACQTAGAAADAACGMLDISEDAEDEQTLISTAGQNSYTIVTDGNTVLSKQIQTSTGFTMQCWNTDDWAAAQTFELDENSNAEDRLFECNGRVLVVGSQGALCTENSCSGHGACIVHGASYICNCNTGFQGTDCSVFNAEGTSPNCTLAEQNNDRVSFQNLGCTCDC